MSTMNINTTARSFLQDLYIAQQTDSIPLDPSMHYGSASPSLIHTVDSIANVNAPTDRSLDRRPDEQAVARAPRTTSALKQGTRLGTCSEVAEYEHDDAKLQQRSQEDRSERNQKIRLRSYRKAALIGFLIGMTLTSAVLAIILSLWLVRSGEYANETMLILPVS